MKDPDAADVIVLDDIVIKRHRTRHRFTNELVGFANCFEFAPRLIHVDMEQMELLIERCLPLKVLKKDPSHPEKARELLTNLHESGWNHRDCSVENMVMHPSRGLLLIDWETVWKVPGDPKDHLSYDLHGAHNTAYPPEDVPLKQQPEGVWWGSGRYYDPGVYWGTL